MALISCPECGREISDQAVSCPNCGSPVKPTNKKFCKFCGEQIDMECVVCPKCGKQVERINPDRNIVINNSASTATSAASYVAAAPQKQNKKESPFGIIGLIVSLIFCYPIFPVIGFILCALGLRHKNHSSVCGIVGIVFSIPVFIFSCVIALGFNESNSNTPANSVEYARPTAAPRSTSDPASTPMPTSTPKPDTYITLEEFNLIETGMSYDEVVEIVGCEGTLMSTVELMDINTSMYYWYGKNGIANANVMFENDAVISKGQIGLD